jgi:23S rRNA (cytidine1920-2'-O)/16S rRNA (cytidine1409-2'-O)-methyltransferase
MSMKSFHRRSHRPPHAPKPAAGHARSGVRTDQRLVELGLAPSRAAAQRLVEAGRVRWEGQILSKPAHGLPVDARPEVLPAADDAFERYVSRGGVKLAGALARCGLAVAGRVCLDVGQSTGGFTDCLLQAGAAKVVGVEVGHGQLHLRLAAEPRCVTLEGVNARHLSAADLGAHYPPGGFDLIVCDASFISLALLLPQWPALLAPGGHVLALVKPQFEVGREQVGKGGVVRDDALRAQAVADVAACAVGLGYRVAGQADSRLAGPKGNREVFLHLVPADADPGDASG